MKIVIRKKMSTCEAVVKADDLTGPTRKDKSKLFSRPTGEVPETPLKKTTTTPKIRTQPTFAGVSLRLSKAERDIESLANDVVNRIAPRVAQNIRRQNQFNKLVSQELEYLAKQIGKPQEIKRKTPDLEIPKLQSKSDKPPEGLSGGQLDRYARAQALRQQGQQQQVSEETISEIRIRIENK